VSKCVRLVCFFLCLSAGVLDVQAVFAQTPDTLSASPLRPQSTAPSQGLGCNADTQRVCLDDSRSCDGSCATAATLPSAGAATAQSCASRCCTRLKACLAQRGCDIVLINCE
jgi:hypothetical protein